MIKMRILQLHSNFIEYKPVKKEATLVEEAEKKPKKLEDVVVLFTSVEEGDNEKVAKRAVDEIKGSLKQLKANRILIYPYAHLSNRLAKPREALEVLKKMETYARKVGLETYRTPFGWCKQFSLSIKGHPLAEQLHVISPSEREEKAEKVSKAIKAEEKLKSYWFILQPNGEMVPVEKFDFKGHEMLEKFARYEISKVRAVQQIPPHVKLMKKLGIADYEAGSDPGNFRWPPKGRLIKALLEQYVTQKTIEYGAMEVETPVMYDFNHPSLANYLDRFPARQYLVKSEDKELFLRFSACFGQFLMVHDAQISYRQLPLRIYELTRYSFRREKSGELVGLRRLRAFTMPDCHALCANLEQAKEEFFKRFDLCTKIMADLGFSKEDYELAIRFTKSFYQEHKEFIVALVKRFGKPALIEMWDERFFYFILKWEFNFIDNLNKASALSTDQIDTENAERYDVTYIDEKGEKRHPLILHCSPSGAIERCIYAMLEKAYREQLKGKAPTLPLWIAPIQVRVIPVSDSFLPEAEKIAEELERKRIRVDIDDRALTLPKKVREAETQWISYILVIGQKEVDSGILAVRDREAGKIKKMSLQRLIETIKKKTADKPFQSLTLPKYLSKRPQFSF
jgi:threonyl-tRNA synthetase